MVTSMSQQRDDFSIRLGSQAKSCSHELTNVHTTMYEQAHEYVDISIYAFTHTYIHTYIRIRSAQVKDVLTSTSQELWTEFVKCLDLFSKSMLSR